ncbi:Lrp/AsnC ligand binding domain-containing protein [Streptomyces sp. NPDC060006]|uniref:Lrp/AsnC ligand binding domain-containing protein n=1 Tax=Streptomyces sp. NPDC060006 TaxID=3347035 RepID=UPI003689A300
MGTGRAPVRGPGPGTHSRARASLLVPAPRGAISLPVCQLPRSGSAPSALAEVGNALAGHPESGFAAATTGQADIVASVVCRDSGASYTYLSGRIAGLDGVGPSRAPSSCARSNSSPPTIKISWTRKVFGETVGSCWT